MFITLRSELYLLWRTVDQHGAELDILALANVKHVFVKAAARLNNRAENSHQPSRERERRMPGFRDLRRTQKFLSRFGPIRQHFKLPKPRIPIRQESMRSRNMERHNVVDERGRESSLGGLKCRISNTQSGHECDIQLM